MSLNDIKEMDYSMLLAFKDNREKAMIAEQKRIEKQNRS